MTLRVPKSPPSVDVASSVSVGEMEAMLTEWFNSPVVLASSGRSALLITLQELGFGRYTHRIALPRFISRCVLDAVIHTAFPVDATEPHVSSDATLLYDQYGFMQRVRPTGLVIEDIAHAFFSEPHSARTLAIFSLPKFFSTASMAGGVIVADPFLAHRIRERRDTAPAKDTDVLEREAVVFRAQKEGDSELPLVYTARLLNPRIESSELGGLPVTVSELFEVRRKRRDVMDALLAAGDRLIPNGWADMLRDHLPYAFPVSATESVLERLNRELHKAGVESDTYRIDVDRNMRHPRYESMLLIPYSHLVPEPTLREMVSILRSA